MRENLGVYRGKRIRDGVWLAGFFAINDDRCYICPNASDVSFGDNGNRMRIGCWYEVDPFTLGEYIGLHDADGKRVFEGDILGYWNRNKGKYCADGVVQYGRFNCSCCSGVYGWYIDGGDIRTLDDEWVTLRLKVIGNIHDNPELLEEL